MKFYKHVVLPCTTSIPRVQDVATSQDGTLLACNDADIHDLSPEELEYIGDEEQELLFVVDASSSYQADEKVNSIRYELINE